jgi:hypothetical protein
MNSIRKTFSFALILGIALLLIPSLCLAKTHKSQYPSACSTIWPGIKDVLKTSNKYNILNLDSAELMASYTVGSSVWTGKRINSVTLTAKGTGCEMAVNSDYRGLQNNDAADFKKRVDESLASTPAPLVAPVVTPVPSL